MRERSERESKREKKERERERVRERRERREGFSTVSVCRQEQWWQHTIHYNICILRKTLQCH